jgi:hypothetical protein
MTKSSDDYIDYMYKSALAIVKNAKLFGESIDIDNSKEVIATLYAVFLNHDYMVKITKNEALYEEELYGTK